MAATSHATSFPAALREDAIIITVTRDGTLCFGNTKIVVGDLLDQIQQAINRGAYKTIFLEVDVGAKYGDAKAVAGRISAAGSDHLVVLVESPRPSPL